MATTGAGGASVAAAAVKVLALWERGLAPAKVLLPAAGRKAAVEPARLAALATTLVLALRPAWESREACIAAACLGDHTTSGSTLQQGVADE